MHTANGNYYTSVSIETANASAYLCIETGAIFVELKELQPYHWTNAYPAEELERWQG